MSKLLISLIIISTDDFVLNETLVTRNRHLEPTVKQ